MVMLLEFPILYAGSATQQGSASPVGAAYTCTQGNIQNVFLFISAFVEIFHFWKRCQKVCAAS